MSHSTSSVCSPELVRELMLTIEFMRRACEHANGASKEDRAQLNMAMRVGIRMNAKHAGQLRDYQQPSFWEDVTKIPAALGLSECNHQKGGEA